MMLFHTLGFLDNSSQSECFLKVIDNHVINIIIANIN